MDFSTLPCLRPAGSQAAHHRDHQQERCVTGDGDAGCFQHHHPHPQHLYWGAAGGRFGGTGDDRSSHSRLSHEGGTESVVCSVAAGQLHG